MDKTSSGTNNAQEALVGQVPLANPFSDAAWREARHWYNCYRAIAHQVPLPMVTSDPIWEELPDWYRDLLAAAMEQFLKTPTAQDIEAAIADGKLAYEIETSLV